MPELYLDCPAGIAGDMFLAAMADLGVDLAVLGATFRHAGLQVDVAAVQARSQGIAGTRLHIEGPAKQPLRHLHDLTGIIGKLPVSEQVRSRSQAALERLGQVEAKVHDVELEQIHFHEIGAVDTLVDVVGAFWAVECLGVTRVTCSKLPWFSGTVRCAHGLMPLPAPATLELLRGKPVYASEYVQEVITPTGALLVDQLVDEFASGPVGRIERTGLGLGTMDLGTVNGLRAMLFSGREPGTERVMVLETNVDHLTGEELGDVFSVLLSQGALDVLFLPGVMKKNRPGGLLQVLCRPGDLSRIRDLVFAQTMTLGLRITETLRAVVPREAATQASPWGQLRVKDMVLDGRRYSRPEFEALKDLAAKTGKSVAQLRYLLGERE